MLKNKLVILCVVMMVLTGCGPKSVNKSTVDQFAAPQKGETIAIMKTGMGDIKIKFFPGQAPKAVENFTKLAEQGYYNNLIFHRVIEQFMIQGGDPTGTGRGGKSIWGKPFEDEFSENLRNYRGALAMANSGKNTNGSQFFIVQNSQMGSEAKPWMESRKFPESVIEQYIQVGGAPWLDNKHTVFGQVFEGMDIVDKIAAVDVDPDDKPLNDVRIESITIAKQK